MNASLSKSPTSLLPFALSTPKILLLYSIDLNKKRLVISTYKCMKLHELTFLHFLSLFMIA